MAKQRSLHIDNSKLIELAKQKDRQAQFLLFDKLSPKMLSVCRQYIKDIHFAEDVMVNSFYKVFKNIKKYEPKGSFESWVRKVMINECISYLRTQKNRFDITELSESHTQQPFYEQSSDIQQLIDELPLGCKTIFLLYVVEGYKHKEIAELLKISEGTSKSQLFHARKLLQNQIIQLKKNESKR